MERWKLQDCGDLPVFSVVGNAIAVNDIDFGDAGSMYTAMYMDDCPGSQVIAWRFTIASLKSSIFVGFTDNKHFQKGYYLKALLFGGPGNLSNGSSLLVASFGNTLREGDKIDFIATLGDYYHIYIVHNDVPLGLAFRVKSNLLNELNPVISFGGPATVTLDKLPHNLIPPSLERVSPTYTGIEGYWKMFQYSGPGSDVDPFVLNLTINEDEPINAAGHQLYRIRYPIVNSFWGVLERGPGDEIVIHNLYQTLMGGSPRSMEKELRVCTFMTNANRLTLPSEESLIIYSSDCEMHFERYSQTPPKGFNSDEKSPWE